jgi:hypothetical protein
MGMKAIEEEDFSYIEGLLDPEGKMYRESQRYIHTINEKGMEEEVFDAEVQDICISCHGTDLEEGVGACIGYLYERRDSRNYSVREREPCPVDCFHRKMPNRLQNTS